MPLNPSPQRQSVVTFPTPNVNDILFFETVDAERIGTDVPEYGTKHPDYKRWPDHRLVHIEAVDDQSRYYRYYYAADQIDQDDDNWSFSKADIGGTKFDAVTREYVIRRSEFDPDAPAMGAVMPDVPEGKFDGTHVLAQRRQIPINDKVLNGLYVIEQRTYVKKVPLYRLDYDEFFRTTNYTKQTLYYTDEIPEEPSGLTLTISELVAAPDNDYWVLTDGIVRTAQQLSDNWYAVTEQEVVKCSSTVDLQLTATQSVLDAISGKTTSDLNLFVDYASATSAADLTRNTNCWAHNLKGITGFVAWNDRVSEERLLGGVAITPKHILTTGHANYTVGDRVYFCSRDNTIYEREIVSSYRHISYSSSTYFDYAIARLDSDLPSDIEILKVLPEDGYKYFNRDQFDGTSLYSPNSTLGEVLMMTTDQDENAHIRKVSQLHFGSFDFENPDAEYHKYVVGQATAYSSWSEAVVGGDSGSVSTLVIGDECVLLGVMSGISGQYTVEGAFLGAPRNYKDVNTHIGYADAVYSSIPSGYELTPFDLSSSYRNYLIPAGACAGLQYTTVVTYAFPPILADVQFDTWNLRSGGARTYPRVLYSRGAFRGPCKAVVNVGWSTTQPTPIAADNKPEPEAITVQNPLFTLSIPPTLHEALSFTVSVGTEDETWEPTNAAYSKGATNVTSWEAHVVSSEVKPFRGGWLMETLTVYPPA